MSNTFRRLLWSLRPRFSLKLLLGVFTAIAVSLGLWCDAARRQHAAVEGTRDAGLEVAYEGRPSPWGITQTENEPLPAWDNFLTEHLGIDYARPAIGVYSLPVFFGDSDPTYNLEAATPHLRALPRLKSISIRSHLTDDDFKYLAAVRSLEALSVQGEFHGNGLAHFAGHPHLKRLVLHAGDDAALEQLPHIEHLEHVGLCANDFTDRGLENLAKCPALVSLELQHQSATIPSLRDLTNLRTLKIWDLKFSDEGVSEMAHLEHLEELELVLSHVSSAALPKLARHKRLQTLVLSCTHMTDQHLEALLELPHLRRLDISGTNISASGLELLAGHPALEVIRVRAMSKISPADLDRIRTSHPQIFFRTDSCEGWDSPQAPSNGKDPCDDPFL